MPRAIWSGAISFGLVNVPVRMYSAIEEQDVHFHLLHEKDDSRIGYEKVCKKEGKAVPDDEIVRGYEVSEGKYVYVTDEDLEAAAGESFRPSTSRTSSTSPRSTRSTSSGARISVRARARRSRTPCSCARWRSPAWSGSRPT